MQIKAAVARRYGSPLRIEALDLDEPRVGEIVVRLVACGVAHCDIEAIAGRSGMPLPFVPGSEAAGIVERTGEGVDAPAPGDAVLVSWSACGTCAACVAGDARHCEAFAARNLSGRREDGSTPLRDEGGDVLGFFHGQSAFATHLVCRATDAVTLDSGTPLEVAAALCGDFLTGAAPILRLPDARPGDAIAIAGADVVGMAACMVAKSRGFDPVIVSERNEARRTLALEVGATIAVPDTEGLAAVVKSLSPNGAVLALETTGTDAGLRACVATLADGGICALARSSHAPGEAALISADTGIRASDLLPQLLALYKEGALPVEKLVNFFPFEQINDAVEASTTASVVKAVVRFSLGSFGDLDRARREGAATDEPEGEPTSEPSHEDAEPDRAPTADVTA